MSKEPLLIDADHLEQLYRQAQEAAERNAQLYEQVKESEAKYRDIFEKAVVGMYQSTREGKILAANQALVHMLGYDSQEELLATDIEKDLYVDVAERRKNLDILHRTGRLTGAEFELRRKDGSTIVVEEHARAVTDARGNLLYYEGTLIDITEKKALERQLMQAQRLESVGTLAAGIAHNFNNLLTVILGYTSLLLTLMDKDDPNREALTLIEQAGKRAAELTSQLLMFSRQITAKPVVLNPNLIVDHVGSFLRRSLDSSIRIQVKKAPDLWNIEADPTQMEQMVMNLCVNARDAMPAGGELRITTENVIFDRDHPRVRRGEVRPGAFVALKVADTGIGIPPEYMARIYDPFFTTKDVGKGTGLGLAIVYGIVKSCGGFIDAESKLGAGTCFTVYLPACRAPTPTPSQIGRGPSEAKGTILVVDDEPAVLRVAKSILKRGGYDVLVASSGSEALELYEREKDTIALVLLDLTMPEMSGIACYQWLSRMNPQVKLILSSGYDEETIDQETLAKSNVQFVQKPYRSEELLATVEAMLGR